MHTQSFVKRLEDLVLVEQTVLIYYNLMAVLFCVWLVTDLLGLFMQGLGKLSVVAASAAQSAASVVQAGTKDFTTKVFWFTVLE